MENQFSVVRLDWVQLPQLVLESMQIPLNRHQSPAFANVLVCACASDETEEKSGKITVNN